MKTKTTAITASLAAALLLASSVTFADSSTFTGAAKDAWLTGKIETAYVLNGHLNPFAISTSVDGGAVHLTGTVKDGIDRDLAGEVARGVDGVVSVKNDLKVDEKATNEATAKAKAKSQKGDHRDFGLWVSDVTMTARVKSRLIGNSNVHAAKIDVDTKDHIVTLSGRVASSSEKSLAEQLARNTSEVKTVHNNLVVDAS
jgi:osmotically-inducible protein OsmY